MEMTIKQLYDEIDGMDDIKRAKILNVLFDKHLTHLSRGELMNFQNNWDGSKPFQEFLKEQNKVIKMCIEMEFSEVGKLVRGTAGKSYLHWDDKIIVED